MRVVSDLMTRTVATLRPTDTVEVARREMELSNIRHFPVVDRHQMVIGVLSDRDVGRAPDPQAPVREVMTEDVLTVSEDMELSEAAYLILRHRIGSLPVCSAEGRLVGIVTEADFVRLAYAMLGGSDLEDRLREEHESERL